ncbi:MAG: tyrosine-type recombinase/integrase [Solirubrobacteraceae bacterium]
MTIVATRSGPILIGGHPEPIVGFGQEARRRGGANCVRLDFVQRRASIPAFLGHVGYVRQRWAAETSKDHERSLDTQEGAAQLSRANAHERGLPRLPQGITPHSLRRTFASVLYALGEDPGVVMDEMGHTDPALALRVYRQAMRRGEEEGRRLRALVDGP